MKINFVQVSKPETTEYLEDLKHLNELNSYFAIKKFNGIKGTISLDKVDSILSLTLNLNLDLTLISSYSLKEFNKRMKLNDTVYFTDKEELESDDVFLLKGIEIDVEEIIYSELVASLPVNIHDKGEKLPKIDGVDVYSEDDAPHSSPFDVLKDLDL